MTEFLDHIWTSLPMPALVVDGQDKLVGVNPAAETFINEAARSLIGQPFLDRVSLDTPVEPALARIRENNAAVFVNSVDVTCGHQPPQPCDLHLGPITAMPGHILVILQPRHLADRMGRSRTISATGRSVIGMAEMLAHEIKNPLAGITGAAQLLSIDLTAQDQELTDLIVEESRRIVTMLEEVERFGHAAPPNKRVVNLHDVLDRARSSASVGFAAHMQFNVEFDPSLPPTFGDSDQLVQVFLNLFRNAAQAADEARGGAITLRTYYDHALRLRRSDGTGRPMPLQVEVIDDGPGLPDAIADEIFEPFVSGRQNGTGLGLALISKIIAEHEGWIAVESVPGRTVFRVSLPMAEQNENSES